MAFSTILYDLADGVATLTFNRPEVRNACNDVMAEEVQAALKHAERDESVRCLVITGAGPGFCAGQDLAAMREQGGAVSFREHLLKTYNPIVTKLRSLEKPILAAINGAAAGAGWGIALAWGALLLVPFAVRRHRRSDRHDSLFGGGVD